MLDNTNGNQWAQAAQFRDVGDFQSAAWCYAALVKANPRDWMAWTAYAGLLCEQRFFADAVAKAERAVALKPDSPDAYQFCAIALFHLGRPAEARTRLDQAVRLGTPSVHILQNRCMVLAALGEYEAALADADHIQRIQPDLLENIGRRGSLLMQLQRPVEAIQVLDQGIQRRPHHIELLLQKGVLCLQTRDFSTAAACFDRAVAINPRHASAWNNRGCALQETGNLELALSSFDRAITLDPASAIFKCNRARLLHRCGKTADAISEMESIAEVAGHLEDVHFQLVSILVEAKQPIAALEASARALRRHPGSARLLFVQATILTELTRYHEALKVFDTLIGKVTDRADVWAGRGNALLGLEDYEAALHSFRTALRYEPESVPILIHLGIALSAVHRPAEALDCLERAVALKPADPYLQNERGLALQRLGQPRAALEGFSRAVTLDPQFAEAHLNIGNVQYDLGDLDAAKSAYEQAIAINDKLVEAYSNYGHVLAKLKRPVDAIASYRRAVAIRPDLVSGHIDLGKLFIEINAPTDAIKSLTSAVEISANSASAYLCRGVAHLQLGLLDAALSDFDRCVGIDASVSDAHSYRAETLKQLERFVEARQAYLRALELVPDNLHAKQGLFWLCVGDRDAPDKILRLMQDLVEQNRAKELRRLSESCDVYPISAQHGLEQLDFLLEQGLADQRSLVDRNALQMIWARARENQNETIKVSRIEVGSLCRLEKEFVNYRPVVPAVCVSADNNWPGLEAEYLESKPEVVVVDNFLSESALKEMRRFCLISPVWKFAFAGRYLGAFADSGFASALHLQIAEELRQRMPRVLSDHRLEHFWGFKYRSETTEGIDVHADFARVNINFWITPDDANLDDASGGLSIYDVPAPATWRFREYNGNGLKIRSYLEETGARKVTIPYRSNRAVIFNSNLFHETDRFRFKEGYETRRVNITYLFGQGLNTR